MSRLAWPLFLANAALSIVRKAYSMISRYKAIRVTFGNTVLAMAAALLVAVSVHGLGVADKLVQATGQASERSLAEGRQLFENRCAGCHGVDGRGGERGPDIAKDSKAQGHTDSVLTQIIHDGIPSAGMPAFRTLDAVSTKSLIGYVRFLQGKAENAALPGSPENGKQVFFGSARCSECHMAGGAGGFIAPDLSSYGRQRSPEEIRDAIIKPGQQPNPARGTVRIATRSGQTVTGVLRNEDNFSLQLQSLDGAFHLIVKSDVANLTRNSTSLMPSEYGSTLSARELDDLVSFLMSVAQQDKVGSNLKKNAEPSDEEN
jgi:cytochrome c oxidase cbb3-type subunit 3